MEEVLVEYNLPKLNQDKILSLNNLHKARISYKKPPKKENKFRLK